MTYPPADGTPDPYQPSQPPPSDPTLHYPPPYTPPPSSPAPFSGAGYPPPPPNPAPSSGAGYPPPPGYPAGPPVDKSPFGDQGQFGAPGYGGGPGYGTPYPNQVMPTNTMAILALVFAFVFCPAAIVFGHIAKKQIARTGEQGSGLATAGLILGYIFTTIMVLYCAAVGVAIAYGINEGNTSGY
ncbi:DUF4190 domain-containing protein [Actinoplanes sp. NEAU-A12]|uniref:DUF4190 domain-containing protein n=1 Tax=Actinoplanes sandaracinus TaxID=3045177 RepID=A0ABT6WJE3_9ACTN|nr:DUF4190 domain-containing protein [Actinoplanes sandaracinus]MDI6099850.1 DUF4190 domain-containing protein [Actinoplanes sandaracinus]